MISHNIIKPVNYLRIPFIWDSGECLCQWDQQCVAKFFLNWPAETTGLYSPNCGLI